MLMSGYTEATRFTTGFSDGSSIKRVKAATIKLL